MNGEVTYVTRVLYTQHGTFQTIVIFWLFFKVSLLQCNRVALNIPACTYWPFVNLFASLVRNETVERIPY